MVDTPESIAIDSLNTNLTGTTGKLTLLNSTVIPNLEDSVRDMSTQLTVDIVNIQVGLADIVTAVDALDTKLDDLTTAVGDINTTLTNKLDTVITQLTQLAEYLGTFIEAFGAITTQSTAQNVQDIRDDTHEGLQMSKEALRRSGLSSRISAPGVR